MSKRKYNKKHYNVFATTTKKIVREHCAPDPMEPIKETGIAGKIIGNAGDKIIESPLQTASYALTGLSYDKTKDSPYKGSLIYTGWYIGLKAILKITIVLLLGFPALAGFVRFLNADLLTQIKMIAGLPFLILIIYVIVKVVAWVKSIL